MNQRNVSHIKLSKYCDIDARLGFIHQNPIKNRKFLLLYSKTTIKYKKILQLFAEKMAEILNQSEQCQTLFKKKIDLKLEMSPVNALRLEWCYDTGNDKNVTIIRLSMQLI